MKTVLEFHYNKMTRHSRQLQTLPIVSKVPESNPHHSSHNPHQSPTQFLTHPPPLTTPSPLPQSPQLPQLYPHLPPGNTNSSTSPQTSKSFGQLRHLGLFPPRIRNACVVAPSRERLKYRPRNDTTGKSSWTW